MSTYDNCSEIIQSNIHIPDFCGIFLNYIKNDLGGFAQICALFIGIITLFFTYRTLKKQLKQQQADFHFKMDDFRNTNANFRDIRELLYDRESESSKELIKNFSIIQKLDFLNYHDQIYTLIESNLMSIPAAENFFGGHIISCYRCNEFWLGYGEKNRFQIDEIKLLKEKECSVDGWRIIKSNNEEFKGAKFEIADYVNDDRIKRFKELYTLINKYSDIIKKYEGCGYLKLFVWIYFKCKMLIIKNPLFRFFALGKIRW